MASRKTKAADDQDHIEIEMVRVRNMLAHDQFLREKCASRTDRVLDEVVELIRGTTTNDRTQH